MRVELDNYVGSEVEPGSSACASHTFHPLSPLSSPCLMLIKTRGHSALCHAVRGPTFHGSRVLPHFCRRTAQW